MPPICGVFVFRMHGQPKPRFHLPCHSHHLQKLFPCRPVTAPSCGDMPSDLPRSFVIFPRCCRLTGVWGSGQQCHRGRHQPFQDLQRPRHMIWLQGVSVTRLHNVEVPRRLRAERPFTIANVRLIAVTVCNKNNFAIAEVLGVRVGSST
jgi:hypothetical protein